MRKALLLILLSLSPFVFAKNNETLSYLKDFTNVAVPPEDTATLSKMAEVAVISSDRFLCFDKHPKYENMDVLDWKYGNNFGYYSYTLKIFYSCMP